MFIFSTVTFSKVTIVTFYSRLPPEVILLTIVIYHPRLPPEVVPYLRQEGDVPGNGGDPAQHHADGLVGSVALHRDDDEAVLHTGRSIARIYF